MNSNEKITKVEFDQNQENHFNGIITKLGNGNPKTAINNGIIDCKASSIGYNSDWCHIKNAFDFKNDKLCFCSKSEPNSWFCYDFINYRVKISHYSIQSNGNGGERNRHPQNWVIEGSNDENKWEIIDSRSNEKSLSRISTSNTFEIKNNDINKYFRYIRIRQTGSNSNPSTYDQYELYFSAIEFFGDYYKTE